MKWTQGVAISSYAPDEFYYRIDIPLYGELVVHDGLVGSSVDVTSAALIRTLIALTPSTESLSAEIKLSAASLEEASITVDSSSDSLSDPIESGVLISSAYMSEAVTNLATADSVSTQLGVFGSAMVNATVSYTPVNENRIEVVNSSVSITSSSMTL